LVQVSDGQKVDGEEVDGPKVYSGKYIQLTSKKLTQLLRNITEAEEFQNKSCSP
jgi:hypothetical protein